MTQEQIRKAAMEYAIGKTHYRRNILGQVNMDNYSLRKNDCIDDFIDGANLRINSVWHSYEEAKKADLNNEDLIIVYHPKVDKFFIGTLVLTDYYCTNPETGVSMKTQGVAVKYDKHMVAIFTEGTKWAYLKDLMPSE